MCIVIGIMPDPVLASTRVTASSFLTTDWTAIIAARDHESNSSPAMERLCRTYWPAVYAYLRRRGLMEADAQDLTQEFFFRLLDRRYLDQVDPGKGRFRSFLLVAVNHFLVNEWDRARAVKRGGRISFISLDEMAAEDRQFCELAEGLSPERAFDQRWALAVVDRVIERLREEARDNSRAELHELLEPFLTGEAPLPSYRDMAERTGQSEAALKMAVHRLRRRFGELLRAEVTPTVGSPDQVDAEVRDLFEGLGGR